VWKRKPLSIGNMTFKQFQFQPAFPRTLPGVFAWILGGVAVVGLVALAVVLGFLLLSIALVLALTAGVYLGIRRWILGKRNLPATIQVYRSRTWVSQADEPVEDGGRLDTIDVEVERLPKK